MEWPVDKLIEMVESEDKLIEMVESEDNFQSCKGIRCFYDCMFDGRGSTFGGLRKDFCIDQATPEERMMIALFELHMRGEI